MKKLFIFILLTFFTLSPNILLAKVRYDGPTTVEQAKERFFKNRPLDIVEGIWFNEKENAYIAIVKVKSGFYNQWTINHKISKYNGTLDISENIVKTATPDIYIYHTTVYNIYNPSEEKESNGKMILTGNLIEYYVNPVCFTPGRCTKKIEGSQSRIWPQNINDYNHNTQHNEKADYKSFWWVLVLLAGVVFLIYTQTKKNFKEKIKGVKAKVIKREDSFIKKFFEGKVNLVFSYWMMFTLIPSILGIAFYVVDKSKADTIAGLLGWFILIYMIYATIGTWRSATNYKLEKESKNKGSGWAIAAYVSIVVSTITYIVRIIKNLNSLYF
jgi:hypothetical protein